MLTRRLNDHGVTVVVTEGRVSAGHDLRVCIYLAGLTDHFHHSPPRAECCWIEQRRRPPGDVRSHTGCDDAYAPDTVVDLDAPDGAARRIGDEQIAAPVEREAVGDERLGTGRTPEANTAAAVRSR